MQRYKKKFKEEKINITGYRFSKGKVGTKGQAGIFYTLQPQGRGEKKFNLVFDSNKILKIPQEEAEAFEGLPAESILYLYPKSRYYYEDCKELVDIAESNLMSGEIIDIAIALWAKDKGYDAIKYGDTLELQDLTNITKKELYQNLKG